MKQFRILATLAFLLPTLWACAQGNIRGIVTDAEENQPIGQVSILLGSRYTESDESGHFSLSDIPPGIYQLLASRPGYANHYTEVAITDENELKVLIRLERLQIDLDVVEITTEAPDLYGPHHLHNVEGMAIYAGRKTEVLELDRLVANLATNNPRQVYQGIAGLNIWESDGAGLQLSIGARGLNPNRSSNFNTRQNGYDISADALGYPESYYTPPTQALRRIEIVRGAASLQYGPQFGGLLNFVFREGPTDRKFQFRSENTVGSFGLINTFNSIGGQVGDWNYYGFFQHKQGDGWRENSEFRQEAAYVAIRRNIGQKLRIKGEYTHMQYLAQQPGGLMDFEFAEDPRQSKRARNWFKVNWNLAALNVDYRLSSRTRLESRGFFLHAGRDALGELGPINRPDPLRERDLIRGMYHNFGIETRLIHRYQLKGATTVFLTGVRYYQGLTQNQQGDADAGDQPTFQFLNPQQPERSDYVFPSRNVAWFAENLFNIGTRWTLTPGIRFEYIRTASDGYFKERVYSGGQLIFEKMHEDRQVNPRSFVLAGLGIGFHPGEHLELYGNISQNYRSINFSDLAVVNPNLQIDTALSDERGFNADIGLRGKALSGAFTFDLSVFYLYYQDRIGIGEIINTDAFGVEKVLAYRTNIGDARIIGMETYQELNLKQLLFPNARNLELRVFANFSLLNGIYTRGLPGFAGNQVELIPPYSLKTGLQLEWKNFRASWLFNQVGEHFSDATNAEYVVDATRGTIPRYSVQDLSLSYQWHRFRFQSGINNLANARYFTRRAVAYPGPGIIPADARSFYLTVGFEW